MGNALHTMGWLPFAPPATRAHVTWKQAPPALQLVLARTPWTPDNPFLQGALAAWRAARRDPAAGNTTPLSATWCQRLLMHPVLAPHPWRWVWVTMARHHRQLEQAHLWQANQPPQVWRWSSRVNTGVMNSTAPGTWWVFEHAPSVRMVGAFPVAVSPTRATRYQAWLASGQSGAPPRGSLHLVAACGVALGMPLPMRGPAVCAQAYNDPNVRWVDYFHGGDALHAFPRPRYGVPQSAGCVEMPESAARQLYRWIGVGTVVTVSASRFPKGQVVMPSPTTPPTASARAARPA